MDVAFLSVDGWDDYHVWEEDAYKEGSCDCCSSDGMYRCHASGFESTLSDYVSAMTEFVAPVSQIALNFLGSCEGGLDGSKATEIPTSFASTLDLP